MLTFRHSWASSVVVNNLAPYTQLFQTRTKMRTRNKQREKKKPKAPPPPKKTTTHDVLDTAMRKQTQV